MKTEKIAKNNTFTKTENTSLITFFFLLDNGTKEIKTLSSQEAKRLKKTKYWKKVVSATKLQEMHQSVKIKIYAEGLETK
jgi:hypothetical protein